MMHVLLLASWVMSGSTVIVGLNGALQKRFVLSPSASLIPGDVHRATKVQVGVGGKGQDVALALSCLDLAGNIELAQFVGSGAEGDQVYEFLKERIGDDAMSLTVRPNSHMRTCTTIVATDMSTELVEPSGIITEEECQELMAKLETKNSESAGAICVMGSMPPGCPSEMYADIYDKIHGQETLCLIDCVVGLEPLLKTIAESNTRGPAILKVNASELCRLANVAKTSSEVGGIRRSELVDGVQGLLSQFEPYGLEALTGLAITDGKHPAHCITIDKEQKEFTIYQVPVPTLDSKTTLYPIGAGDTVAGGMLSAWRHLEDVSGKQQTLSLGEKVDSMLEERARSWGAEGISDSIRILGTSLAFGLACGSASCLKEENSLFDVDIATKLLKETKLPAFVSTHSIN